MLHFEIGEPELFILVDFLDLALRNFLERPQSLDLVDPSPVSAHRQIEADAHLVDELAAEISVWEHVLHLFCHLIIQLVGPSAIDIH